MLGLGRRALSEIDKGSAKRLLCPGNLSSSFRSLKEKKTSWTRQPPHGLFRPSLEVDTCPFG